MKKLSKSEIKNLCSNNKRLYKNEFVKQVIEQCKLLKKGEGLLVDPKLWSIKSTVGCYVASHFRMCKQEQEYYFKTKRLDNGFDLIVRMK